jgi:hypothetical protein
MARETKRLLGDSTNIVLYRDTAELASLVAGNRPPWQPEPGLRPTQRWANSADEIAALLSQLIAGPNAFASVAYRLEKAIPWGNQPASSEVGHSRGALAPRLPPRLLRLADFIQRRPAIKAVLRPLWRFIFH